MDAAKLMRAVAGTKAADAERQTADALLHEAQRVQFVACTRHGGRWTEEGREMLRESEVLRTEAKKAEEAATGMRRSANLTLYHEASKLLREARKTVRRR